MTNGGRAHNEAAGHFQGAALVHVHRMSVATRRRQPPALNVQGRGRIRKEHHAACFVGSVICRSDRAHGAHVDAIANLVFVGRPNLLHVSVGFGDVVSEHIAIKSSLLAYRPAKDSEGAGFQIPGIIFVGFGEKRGPVRQGLPKIGIFRCGIGNGEGGRAILFADAKEVVGKVRFDLSTVQIQRLIAAHNYWRSGNNGLVRIPRDNHGRLSGLWRR